MMRRLSSGLTIFLCIELDICSTFLSVPHHSFPAQGSCPVKFCSVGALSGKYSPTIVILNKIFIIINSSVLKKKNKHNQPNLSTAWKICRAVTKISSCWIHITSRQGIKQQGISFGSIFLLFSYESSGGLLVIVGSSKTQLHCHISDHAWQLQSYDDRKENWYKVCWMFRVFVLLNRPLSFYIFSLHYCRWCCYHTKQF